MGGCAALQRGGNFWVGTGEGCEIRLSGRDIGKKHTGIRVDEEGTVWITDMGCRGGTRMAGDKLPPHSERRLRGNDFWCGRESRHFRVSRSIPSTGDLQTKESNGEEGGGNSLDDMRGGRWPLKKGKGRQWGRGNQVQGQRREQKSGSTEIWSGARSTTSS